MAKTSLHKNSQIAAFKEDTPLRLNKCKYGKFRQMSIKQ